jgi:hypothetical protein
MLIESLKSSSAVASSAASQAGRAAQTVATGVSGRQSANNHLQQQLDTLSQWSLSADVSRQLAKNQQAEQQLRQLYQQLEQLKKQLNQPQSPGQQQQLREQLLQLQSQLKHKDSAVRPELQLSQQPLTSVSARLSHQIDLLSPRKQSEQLSFRLADGQQVQLSLAANQSAEQNLSQVQQAFTGAGVQVSVQAGQLQFSTKAAEAQKLTQPWQMQGEGIRVAAGNPIHVRLQPVSGPLQVLAEQALQLENQQAYQADISQVQQKLQTVLRQVQAERQELLAKLNSLRLAGNRQTAEDVAVVSQELKQQMQTGAAASLAAIMAQGNVSRSLVEFALADRR